jgi:hypothetical protein
MLAIEGAGVIRIAQMDTPKRELGVMTDTYDPRGLQDDAVVSPFTGMTT